jgi:ABC-type multidrug transport system ATPase subunit
MTQPNEGEQFATFYLQKVNEAEDLELYLDYGSVGKSKKVERTVSSLIYFPVGISSIQLLRNDNFGSVEFNPLNSISKHFYFLDKGKLQDIWNLLNNDLVSYQIEEANLRINLTHKIEKEENTIDIRKEIENWKKSHPNPVEIVAQECLDHVLNKFHLAIKTEINDTRQINALQIKALGSESTIPYEHLSTGTKQIIFTAFPIYQLLEDDSIVLMDEPETSLYPDIQREIIPYYTSFDKNKTSQFFFATHSPIIASAFEPWEIVELKFDEKGKVYRDIYYEGENHVDNYRLDPQILRYDQILTRIFDLSSDSDAKRAEKLQELSILKKKVEKLKKEEMEKPSAETQKIINEYLQLSDDISGTWALSRHEKN